MMSEKSQVPEGYKKTELGEIPQEWEIVKLGEHSERLIVPMRDKPKRFEGSIPWCRIEDFDGKYLYRSKSERVVNDKIISEMNLKIFPIGTVICSCSAKLGVCAIAAAPLITNQTFIGIVPSDTLDKEFLYYLMGSYAYRLQSLSTGTTIAYLPRERFESFHIVKPPYKEQQKIATILSKVDEQIEQTEQIIERTEILKKGLMQKLLTKGIGHTKFKKTELGEIPEEWSVFRLSDLLESKYILSHLDGNHGSNYPKPHEFVESGIPYVSANAIIGGVVDFSKAKYVALEKAKRFKKGIAENEDVLLAHNATVGPTALLKTDLPYVILSTSLTYYRCDLQKISNFYLKYYMESPLFQNQLAKVMKQTTRNQVPITMQRNLYFCLPSIEEQRKIGNVLFCIEKQIMKNANNLAKLQELKKGLMQDLLTGKVRVCA